MKKLDVVSVGYCTGAAVLWTYVELFGDGDLAGLVFVDQAPLQDRSTLFGDDWNERRAWVETPEEMFAGLAADYLGV
ncbi:hypothetical protein TruAng_011268 [Truncatella angustata]|nr:hypothetical protein TruAng_011268 [Truncatella angustata]